MNAFIDPTYNLRRTLELMRETETRHHLLFDRVLFNMDPRTIEVQRVPMPPIFYEVKQYLIDELREYEAAARAEHDHRRARL